MTSSVDSISVKLPKAAPVTFKQALFVAVTAGLGYGFDSYAVNIYGLVLPDIKKALHITDAQAGYIGSIFLLGYTIGTVGFGFAADRWGRKTTLPVSAVPENWRSVRHTLPRSGRRRRAPSVSAA